MKVLVTGGCGTTGSILVKLLKDSGYSVLVVDDLSSGSLENLSKQGLSSRPVLPGLMPHLRRSESLSADDIIVITSDFTDDAVIRHAMLEKYDYIFHLAANTDPICERAVAESTDTNLFKTVALAHLAVKAGAKKFVFASANLSCEEIDSNVDSFLKVQKLSCEMFLKQFYYHYKLNSASVRMSSNSNANATAMLEYCKNDKKGAWVYNIDLEPEKQSSMHRSENGQ